MSNTLTNLLPRFVATALDVLREQATYARLVQKDGKENMPANQGETINFPLPPEPDPTGADVTDVTPANVPPQAGATTVTTTPLQLSKWKKADFDLTLKQQAEIADSANYVESMIKTKTRVLANYINKDIAALYKYVPSISGAVPGSSATPFASDLKAANAAFARANLQLTPLDQRSLIIDFSAEADAKNVQGFSSALEAGDNGQIKIAGKIGHKFGMDWYGENAVPVHTAGAGSGYVADGAQGNAAGAGPLQSILVKTGTGALVVGDILTIAGDTATTGTQVVTAAYTGGAGTIAIFPGIPAGTTIADLATVTKLASHRVGLLFHPWAFGAAFRALPSIAQGNPEHMRQSITDPVTGLALALDVQYQYNQWRWEVSALYGVAALRPQLAVRIPGGNLT